MPRVIPTFDPTVGTEGTIPTNAIGNGTVVFTNMSNNDLLLTFPDGNQRFLRGWTEEAFELCVISGGGTTITWSLYRQAPGDQPPQSYVDGLLYLQGEVVPGHYPVVFPRWINIGAEVVAAITGQVDANVTNGTLNVGGAVGVTGPVDVTPTAGSTFTVDTNGSQVAVTGPVEINPQTGALFEVTPNGGTLPITGVVDASGHAIPIAGTVQINPETGALFEVLPNGGTLNIGGSVDASGSLVSSVVTNNKLPMTGYRSADHVLTAAGGATAILNYPIAAGVYALQFLAVAFRPFQCSLNVVSIPPATAHFYLQVPNMGAPVVTLPLSSIIEPNIQIQFVNHDLNNAAYLVVIEQFQPADSNLVYTSPLPVVQQVFSASGYGVAASTIQVAAATVNQPPIFTSAQLSFNVRGTAFGGNIGSAVLYARDHLGNTFLILNALSVSSTPANIALSFPNGLMFDNFATGSGCTINLGLSTRLGTPTFDAICALTGSFS